MRENLRCVGEPRLKTEPVGAPGPVQSKKTTNYKTDLSQNLAWGVSWVADARHSREPGLYPEMLFANQDCLDKSEVGVWIAPGRAGPAH